ncbi:SPOR domain-containing protein [Marinobacter sp.]|uniref:SPOR domain-containing protein n=1 Tax=Marinobacter sp. TaxID=50741 RepID=UPI002B47534A|nr:SPOR domain-containing protein [Marinobacter sp.]HKK56958.1 SPOR domain-containing protein [Marinobacter sp.]
MNGLKQRIIGALVLVSLAVIFVPMMFDEPHSERETTTIQIPEEPPFPEVEMPEPETTKVPPYRIEETAPAGPDDSVAEAPEPPDTTESSAAAGASQSEPSAQTEPGAAEFTRSLEGAWVVQLGSFGSADNARRLREKVREKGYSSHLQSVIRGDTELTRVFSGPFAEKAEAEKAKQALDKAFGLNSLVTSGGK